MKRLLLDQGLPRTAAVLLREQGIEVQHVGEIGMAKASDAEILDYVQAHQLILVTLDADFHSIMALSGRTAPSVIRLREEGLGAEMTARLIDQTVERAADELCAGALVSANRKMLRIRRLPIGKRRD